MAAGGGLRVSVTYRLPLPPGVLGPNGRGHWAARHRARRDYEETAIVLSAHAIGTYRRDHPLMARARVSYDWHSVQQVDTDNALGRLKVATDMMQGRVYANDRDVALVYRWHKARKRDEGVQVTVEAV